MSPAQPVPSHPLCRIEPPPTELLLAALSVFAPRPQLVGSLTRLQPTPSLLTLTLHSEMQWLCLRVGLAAAALLVTACNDLLYFEGIDFLSARNCTGTPHGGTCKLTCDAASGFVGSPSATCNDGSWDINRGCVQGERAPHLPRQQHCCRQCRTATTECRAQPLQAATSSNGRR